MHQDKTVDHQNLKPSVLIIFGVNGNLSRNKLLPALYHLLRRNMLPDQFAIVGILRSSQSSLEDIFGQVEINLRNNGQDFDREVFDALKAKTTAHLMDCTNEQNYQQLASVLDKLDDQHDLKYQRLFYLAIPPDIFPTIITYLTKQGLNDESVGSARRILVEKPFGVDLVSAKELVKIMATSFRETQIYRIDHYLAKENVQNILAFRFGNPLISEIWSRQFIDCIQISALEKVGVDARGNFYEHMGALRDYVQSHLMQVMALVMMEPPDTLDSDLIHIAKFALLQSVEVIEANRVDEVVVRGQYYGYREEVGNDHSNTDTYAALSLTVNNSRWAGVPILLRTGKSLSEHVTEVNIVFKDRMHKNIAANCLTIRIQPDEGIGIKLVAKAPGFRDQFQDVLMNFSYKDSFKDDSPDAYERVLIDCIDGDQSLFASHEEVMRCWEILQPVIEAWSANISQPEVYNPGSTGPAGAQQLVRKFNMEWL